MQISDEAVEAAIHAFHSSEENNTLPVLENTGWRRQRILRIVRTLTDSLTLQEPRKLGKFRGF